MVLGQALHVGMQPLAAHLDALVLKPGLSKSIDNQAGDFIDIEPGVPHEVFNLSDTEPFVAVVARSDASEWENIVPYDRNAAR
jgi:mannose-6-phosphate isomerase-like protein (cupin superfamily)